MIDEYKSRIKKLLTEYSSDYIIYVPGAGGEFLSSVISKYSNNYDPIQVIRNQSNRWQSHHSILINDISSSFSNSINFDLDSVINETVNRIINSNLDLNDIVTQSETTFKKRNKKNLFRLHLTNNDFFTKNNSFLLNLNSYWLKYASLLLFLKVYNNPIVKFDAEFNIAINRLQFNKINSNLDLLIEFLKSSDIDNTTLAHLEIANEDVTITGNLDMNTFLRLPPKELYNQYSHVLFRYYYEPKIFLEWQNKIALHTNVIDYDKIFNKGYLEEMFDIQSDDFHQELIQWHENNLKLMKDSGADWS